MIGTTLSHYRILSKLGEGGMGEVYLAEDTELKREIALKVLPPEMAEDPERLERFRREARAVAALDHPNIVTIFSIEEADGKHFLTMQRVVGESLDKILTPAGLPLAKVFEIAIPLSSALSAAHEKGITHRDLKPANVMMTPEGQIKVLDFGLAKLSDSKATGGSDGEVTSVATLTGKGVVMGTAPYMSPEQLQGKSVDTRSDIFSLGIMLYEMVAGRRPFQGDSGIDLASSILKDSHSSVSEVRGDLPRHLSRILDKCLEKDPRRRYQTALDVYNDLDGLQGEVKSGELTTGGQVAMPATGPMPQVPSSGPATAVSGPPTAPPTSGPGTVTSDPSAAVHSGTVPVEPSGAVPASGISRKELWIAAAAIALLVLVAIFWLGRRGSESPPTIAQESSDVAPAATEASTKSVSEILQSGQAEVASIAVLPFNNLSGDEENEYFSDGLTEELMSALSQVPGLRVAARTSSFSFKGESPDISEVGSKLNVANVLEGSVRKAGNRVRITTQLIKVDDGFNLWSESFDRELDDIFAVQDEIARSVTSALQIKLLGETSETQIAGAAGSRNAEAYDLFLRARFLSAKRTPESLESAIEMLEEALEIAPEDAVIWAELGLAYMRVTEIEFDAAKVEITNQKGRAALEKSLEINPSLAEAHSRMASIYITVDWDINAARVSHQRALDLNPQSTVVLGNAANFASLAAPHSSIYDSLKS